MHILLQVLPTRIRRRLLGSSNRRRLAAVCAIFVIAIVVFHESSSARSSGRKLKINDRRILESDNVVAVPAIVDAAGLARESHGRDFNPKIIRRTDVDKEANAVVDDKERIPDLDGIVDDVDKRKEQEEDLVTVVLVIAATRPAAIKNHLQQLLRFRPSASAFPIVISQDGSQESVTEIIRGFVNATNHISFIHHKERTGLNSEAHKVGKNYFFIAQHYKWALDKIFFDMNYTTAIITEDDLDIAEDFFSYFSATRFLFREDPTIWCVSAWNDNGGSNITNRSHGEQLHRTDFFPGLGWMLTSELWKELSPKWPLMYWDDFLRTQEVRVDRVCIRPEVSRTAHNNKVAGKGSSGGLYKKYLASIQLPETPVDFGLVDMSYVIKDNYDEALVKQLRESKLLSIEDVERHQIQHHENSHVVVYTSPREYRRISKAVGLMLDIRSGMPRTAYYGVIPFMLEGSRVYAVSGRLPYSESNFLSRPSSEVYDDAWDKMTRFLEFQDTFCTPRKFTGKCDPKNPELIEWFRMKRLTKRLQSWGEMIVN